MKYIIQTQGRDGKFKDVPVLFGEKLVHHNVAQSCMRELRREDRTLAGIKVVGAGFVRLNSGHGLRCWGRSESLEIESRPEDEAIIEMEALK